MARPMMTVWPVVSLAKCLRSLVKCQGSVLFLPMPFWSSVATIR